MSAFLSSTVGKLVVLYVDIICGLFAKAFHYFDGDDDE